MVGLLYINGIDFTQHIKMGTWKVNSKPVYTEWTDYGKKKHKHKHRDQISGSFKVYFRTIEEFTKFFKTIENNKDNSGYVTCQVFLNNLDGLSAPSEITFSYDIANYKPVMGIEDYDGFDITIEER